MAEISFLSMLPPKVKGGLYFLLLVTCILVWGLFWFPLVALLQPIHYRVYQKCASKLGASFFTVMALALRNIHGVEFVITGDPIQEKDNALFFCNHRTRLDWMFLWYPFLQHGSLEHLKIVLKEDLRKYPLIGNAIEVMQFLFLKREWEHDEPHMREMSKVYRESTVPYKVLVFPEGTDLSEKNVRLSDAYAEEHNLPKYTQVLHPKTTGSRCLFNNLAPIPNSGNYGAPLTAVYDAVIAYDGGPPQHESSLFNGRMPRRVQIHIQRNGIKKVMDECKELGGESAASARDGSAEQDVYSNGLSKWIKNDFKTKEDILTRFYEQPEDSRLLQNCIDKPANSRTESRKRQRARSKSKPPEDQLRPWTVVKIICSLMLIPIPFFLHILCLKWGLGWYELSFLTLVFLTNIMIRKAFGGWDLMATFNTDATR
eukprot:gb/GECG01009740.1/.p1 GENE.gb/GECG01009740.1/~~gb/GECG01009740.1/.p1  ORF type:complete len:428 (+),score=29.19 gb/GECG01009740.1/:1-1284(+)